MEPDLTSFLKSTPTLARKLSSIAISSNKECHKEVKSQLLSLCPKECAESIEIGVEATRKKLDERIEKFCVKFEKLTNCQVWGYNFIQNNNNNNNNINNIIEPNENNYGVLNTDNNDIIINDNLKKEYSFKMKQLKEEIEKQQHLKLLIQNIKIQIQQKQNIKKQLLNCNKNNNNNNNNNININNTNNNINNNNAMDIDDNIIDIDNNIYSSGNSNNTSNKSNILDDLPPNKITYSLHRDNLFF